ncbi:hypothetical protein A0257_10890 [Hymenobacter psoromatis]|nr:hypothetical protein A0257_10890 [Hymenobacter psoromatis]
MKPVNLKALAQQLNLSIATVSRALNDSYDISQATKERVRRLAAQLNYVPNPHASSLRRNRSNTIGVVIPEITNSFFSLVLNGIEDVARRQHYHVLIYLTHDDGQREAAAVELLASGRVDGVLLSAAGAAAGPASARQLVERGIPLVLFDRIYAGLDVACVTTDDYASAHAATRHLLQAGCRTVAHFTLAGQLSVGTERQRGYRAALLEAGRGPGQAVELASSGYGPESQAAIEALLRQRPDVDGIFAAVESLALSSYQACQRLGLAIPADIKLISFSNSPVLPLLTPALSTVTQPAFQMGQAAAERVFRAIATGRPARADQSLELRSELVGRASTRGGPAPGRVNDYVNKPLAYIINS